TECRAHHETVRAAGTFVSELKPDILNGPEVDAAGDAALFMILEIQSRDGARPKSQIVDRLPDPYTVIANDRDDLRIIEAASQKAVLQKRRPPVILEVGPKSIALPGETGEFQFNLAFKLRRFCASCFHSGIGDSLSEIGRNGACIAERAVDPFTLNLE